jgi:hypothetical protein
MVSANRFDCHSPAPVQKPVQVQGSTSKEYGEDIGGAVSRNWECGRQEKRREQAMCSHARHRWDHSRECGHISSTEFCATVSLRKWGITFDSMAHTLNQSTHASVQDPCLPVSDNCVPRKADKVCDGIRWSLAAEPSHSGTHLVLNPCDYLLWGYLKDKVFSSAPRTLPELQERIKESCAQITRGMLTRVVQNFVLHLQAVWESQGAHIEHVIHKATHMWNSNPCLLLLHCFRINKFAIANALLSWKWQ